MGETFGREYWNDEAGERWARSHVQLDRLMQPYADLLLDRSELASGMRVVDVGCGSGAVTRAAARICGPGRVHGVDVSSPLLRLAESLASEAELDVGFVEQDAAEWQPEHEVDRVVSRFGVMFFEDPALAFRNIRSWLGPAGRLVALAWQSPEANPWISEPVRILAEHLGLPEEQTEGPGPHSLADPEHVESLLSGAGFDRVRLEGRTIPARIDGDLEAACDFYLGWGPTARFYGQASEEVKPAIEAALRRFAAAHHDGDGLELSGRVWLVEAS